MGRKSKTLELGATDEDNYGYALFFIVAVEENGLIRLQALFFKRRVGI